MLAITNPKIAGFAPRWASYRGLTILFDNIGLRRDGPWLRLDCALDAIPEYTLYRGLRATMCHLNPDLLLQKYLFCALPPRHTMSLYGMGQTMGMLGRHYRTCVNGWTIS